MLSCKKQLWEQLMEILEDFEDKYSWILHLSA